MHKGTDRLYEVWKEKFAESAILHGYVFVSFSLIKPFFIYYYYFTFVFIRFIKTKGRKAQLE